MANRSKIANQDIDPKEKAFLDTLAWTLETLSSTGYYQIIDGSLFSNFRDHPRVQKTGKFYGSEIDISADSAGRYHIDSQTWKDLLYRPGIEDFSPESQNRAAIELLRDHSALGYLENDKFELAVYKASQIWGTLPDEQGRSHLLGVKPKSMKDLKAIYEYFLIKDK